MNSTAMALWSAGGATASACSPLNRICSQPAAAADASTSLTKTLNFNSNRLKKSPPSSSSSLAVAADPVYRNKKLSIMTMSATRSLVSLHAAFSLGGVGGPNRGITGMIIGFADGTRVIRRRSNNFRTSPPLSAASSSSKTTTSNREEEEEEGEGGEAKKRVGGRVRVKVPLKVYHVPRVPEVDLTGLEGHVKQYVGLWKGKRISANLPYKVEFVVEVEGRGPVKFFAHLKEDEFEFLD